MTAGETMRQDSPRATRDDADRGAKKRAYAPPRLVRYGDVAQLTRQGPGGPLKDGGTLSKSRTK
jgi:hypothetical protein